MGIGQMKIHVVYIKMYLEPESSFFSLFSCFFLAVVLTKVGEFWHFLDNFVVFLHFLMHVVDVFIWLTGVGTQLFWSLNKFKSPRV